MCRLALILGPNQPLTPSTIAFRLEYSIERLIFLQRRNTNSRQNLVAEGDWVFGLLSIRFHLRPLPDNMYTYGAI